MNVSSTTIGVIAALCVALGAGGAYLVTGGGTAAAPEPSAPTDVNWVASANPAPEPVAERAATHVAPAPAPSAIRQSARPVAPAPRQARATNVPSATTPGAPIETRPTQSPDAPAFSSPAPDTIGAPAPEPVADAGPPSPQFEELVLAADSVIGLQIETSTTSDRAEIEDPVLAHVTRDVRVAGKVAIPAGSKVQGEVTLVERGGRVRERARLGVRFTRVLLPGGARVRLASDTVYREGDSPGRESAAKIGGGAIGGAIIGGILGGAKGAAIGGSVGAGAGTTAVLAGGRNPATLPSGTPVTVRLTEPATVIVDRQ